MGADSFCSVDGYTLTDRRMRNERDDSPSHAVRVFDHEDMPPVHSVNTALYRQAFNRIREYLEPPGMRLTPAEVQRLSGIDAAICKRVLDDLVLAKFLQEDGDGGYARGLRASFACGVRMRS